MKILNLSFRGFAWSVGAAAVCAAAELPMMPTLVLTVVAYVAGA